MRKPYFCMCENKSADQLSDNPAADQHLCFAAYIGQSLYFLELYSLVYVGPGHVGWKPRRQVFL